MRYVVRGEPTHVGRCHCADCRKESGSAFTVYAQWPVDRFELTGEVATYDGRSFCPRCGGRIGCLDDTEAVELRIGSLDDAPFELVPEAEIWIKRREPWLPAVPGASQHEENRH
ncbi:MAG TPA: GFA family protein [Gaiellaceae bacterium]